jgi:hypothetical protein
MKPPSSQWLNLAQMVAISIPTVTALWPHQPHLWVTAGAMALSTGVLISIGQAKLEAYNKSLRSRLDESLDAELMYAGKYIRLLRLIDQQMESAKTDTEFQTQVRSVFEYGRNKQ